MKTPKFWTSKGIISTLLLPLGKLYAWIGAYRIAHGKTKQVNKPVICIGNLTAGGTGKTPVAISVAKILQKKGYNPAFVSRGYGGKLKGVMVEPHIHTAEDVGDEPLLLSKQAPVSINPDRYAAAQKAIANGADIIVMDDGYQNPSLKKDLSFLVFDGGFGVGNGRPVPSGPLREDLEKGLERANAIIIIGNDIHGLAKQFKLPIFKGKIEARPQNNKNKKVLAFAGIGRPEKFYQSLRDEKFKVVETVDFPDHHYYTSKELKELIDKAQSLGADIYTTSKDMVKIPPELQHRFKVLEIHIKWEDEASLGEFISYRLG